MRRWVVLAVAIGVPGALVACSSIFGFQDLTLLDAGVIEAGTDATTKDASAVDAADARPTAEASVEASTEAAVNEGGGCVHAYPVGPPTTDDTPDGGDGGVDIVFALQTLDLGQSAGAFNPNDPLGFDLDHVCTCIDDGGPSCTNGTQQPVCDTAGGRDESANVILAALAEDPNLSQQTLQADITNGKFGLLLHVHGYNGLANDETVIVEYFPSPGAVGTPSFDGGDQWNVTGGSVLGGNFGDWSSNYQDLHAYVNDFALVSTLGKFPLLILPDTGANDNPLVFNLVNVIVQATLAKSATGGWSMQNGQVGARWPTNDALYSLHTVSEGPGQSLCGTQSTYKELAAFICAQVDIEDDPTKDSTGLPCNSLSVGLGFTATPANFADAFDASVTGVDCPDAWAPSCGD